MPAGYISLATGEVFEGEMIGCEEPAAGEVVFTTSMNGYESILTDPTYAGQIVIFSYPIMGQHSFQWDELKGGPYPAGVIVQEVNQIHDEDGSTQPLGVLLKEKGISLLTGVDTRALIKAIRRQGTVQGVMASGSPENVAAEIVMPSADTKSNHVVSYVSTTTTVTYPSEGPHLVVVDLGLKQSLLETLLDSGCQVTVVPYSATLEMIQSIKPAGVVYSNGPGDPQALTPHLETVRQVTAAYPTLGIGLGHQLIALAYGAETTKLKTGHRGENHPVKEMETGRVLVTSQHHGFAVVEESVNSQFEISYRHVNDHTVEGLIHKERPIYTLQFHPHALAGELASVWTSFLEEVRKGGPAYAFA